MFSVPSNLRNMVKNFNPRVASINNHLTGCTLADKHAIKKEVSYCKFVRHIVYPEAATCLS